MPTLPVKTAASNGINRQGKHAAPMRLGCGSEDSEHVAGWMHRETDSRPRHTSLTLAQHTVGSSAPLPTMGRPSIQEIVHDERVSTLLETLHNKADRQRTFRVFWFHVRKYLGWKLCGPNIWSSRDDDFMRDKYVALDREKCQCMYLLARAINAQRVVEAGTSFGVSTTWLATAVRDNGGGLVIGTEIEPTKVAQANVHIEQAGLSQYVEIREGDLHETLKEGIADSSIDLVLLDIWTPVALPALELLKPRLRKGAVILVDNTSVSIYEYNDLKAYVAKPENGFRTVTMPYKGGFEMMVYLPG